MPKSAVQAGMGAIVHENGVANITILHADQERKLLAFHRSADSGPGDDVVVVANFSQDPRETYRIGFPREGSWKLRLNTGWVGYSSDFGDFSSQDALAEPGEYDGVAWSGDIAVGPYSALIFSQDA